MEKSTGQDVMRVEASVVSCDGRSHEDNSGHPLVYLNTGEEGHVTCPYCSRRFIFTRQTDYKG